MRRYLPAIVPLLLCLTPGCGSSASASGGSMGGKGGSTNLDGGIPSESGTGGVATTAVAFPDDPTRPLDAPVTEPPGPDQIDALCGSVNYLTVQTVKSAVANAHGMASATRARELLSLQTAPPSESIRAEDFLNYYGAGAAMQVGANTITTHASLRALKIDTVPIPRRFELFVAIQAGPVGVRPPVALTVLVDTTPSMSGEPLARAKESVRALLSALTAKDHLTLITTDSTLVFDKEITDPAELKGLETALSLGAEGTLRTPIEAALGQAKTNLNPLGWNRVVVVSDGEGDPVTLPIDAITTAAQTDRIWLSAVGVGGGAVSGDALLFRASQAGRGSYVYIDAMGEPEKLLHQRFDELYGVVYDDVKLSVDLPWFFTLLDSLPAATGASMPQPQYLGPNGTMSFLFSLEACHDSVLAKYGLKYKIGFKTSFTDPFDPNVQQQTTQGLFPSDIMGSSQAGMNSLLATRAYVSALKAPTDARVADALGLLEPLVAAGNAFEEMAGLLKAYPKKL